MRAFLFTLLTSLLLIPRSQAQEDSFYGYVKSETIHDTRQVAQVREGQFHLYPLRPLDDNLDGNDDRDQNNLLMAAFQSRLGVKGSADLPESGRVLATLEADFFGQNDTAISMLRLRLAFVSWNRGAHAFLAGQTWSPLFTAGLHPGVVGFATGAPFQPFARFPQLRYTWTGERLTFIAAASTQRDAFAEIGGAKMQQQSGQPALHAHLTTHWGRTLLGAGGTTKKVLCFLDGPSFRANAWTAYGRYQREEWQITAKVVRGQDLTDHLMTGGFLATSSGSVLPAWVNAGWLDFTTGVRPNLDVGLFVGALSNRGMESGLDLDVTETFVRAADLESLIRLAPRVVFTQGPMQVSLELEMTRANYATQMSDDFRPLAAGAESVTNVRSLLAVYYHF